MTARSVGSVIGRSVGASAGSAAGPRPRTAAEPDRVRVLDPGEEPERALTPPSGHVDQADQTDHAPVAASRAAVPPTVWERSGAPGHSYDPHEVTVQLDGGGRQLDDPLVERGNGGPVGGGGQDSDGPVFVDESGRRRRRLRRLGMVVGIACAVYAVVIVATLLSGNSNAPWLPVPRQKDDTPAARVDTSPPPSHRAHPSAPAAFLPSAGATADAGKRPSKGGAGSTHGPSARASAPAASTAPRPSASTAKPKPGSSSNTKNPAPGPSDPVGGSSPAPTPSGGVTPEPSPSPATGGPVANGPVANGPVGNAPVANGPVGQPSGELPVAGPSPSESVL
ncbi:hypothetical protein ABZ612_16880 [Streptomyces avermitilis]|uniref:hypothetical protein n=1 Tax=Streptomyces avermitilis TaxID=33903 RepID=UPI00340E120E